jgi:ABC-type polysaccharide/polyol phosphate export permease
LTTKAPSAKQSLPGNILGALSTFYTQRWLLRYFIHRQLTRSYQRSLLGFLWAFLGPLLMVALLTLVFSEMIGLRFREVDGNSSLNFGLYLYCGLLPFLAYSESLGKGVNSIRGSSGLVQKVIFPLEFLPFSSAVTSLIDKFFGLGALFVVLVVVGQTLHPTALLLPVIIVPQLLFILGLAYLMAIAGTYLPDVAEMLRAIVRATFFITPIIWPADRVPEDSALRPLIDYNPLAFLVQTYRDLILTGNLPSMTALGIFSAFSLILFVFGFALFVRVKSNFADLL